MKTGNLLAVRVALMILVCSWLNLRWVLEQPSGSSMHLLNRFQQLWSQVQVTCSTSIFGLNIKNDHPNPFDSDNRFMKGLLLQFPST